MQWGSRGAIRRRTHFSNQPKGHEHELTNPRIASRKHHFRTDKLIAITALSYTTRGTRCWTADAALAKRDCLRDIRWSEYLAMEGLPNRAAQVRDR
jgi:hypothetical protein